MKRLAIAVLLTVGLLSSCTDDSAPGTLYLTDGTTRHCDSMTIRQDGDNQPDIWCDSSPYPASVIEKIVIG